jgi:hypothetical protein
MSKVTSAVEVTTRTKALKILEAATQADIYPQFKHFTIVRCEMLQGFADTLISKKDFA